MKYAVLCSLLTASLLYAPLSARAESECANVDHSDHFGDPRDQGRNGWCFAYTAADLMGEKLGIKAPDMISALDVSASYAAPPVNAAEAFQNLLQKNKLGASEDVSHFADQAGQSANQEHSQPLEAREGGYISSAIAFYNLKGGYCLESALPSRDLHYEDTVAMNGTPYAHKRDEYDLDSTDYIYNLVKGIERNKGFEYPHQWECDHWEDVSNQNIQTIMAVANLATQAVVKELDHRCGKRNAMPVLVPEYHSAENHEQSLRQIQKLLASGKSVGIDYDAAQIKADAKPGSSYLHASLVVGSRLQNGACQFKIRNSWGADCTAYKKVKDCQNGSFWVTGEQLTAMMQDYNWIK